MSIEDLKSKLCKFGVPVIVKEGFVFTVFIQGANLTNWKNMDAIQKLVLDYAGEKYPLIEAMVNDNDFYLLVMKPK